MPMTSAQKTAARYNWREDMRKHYIEILDSHLTRQEKLWGISPDCLSRYPDLDHPRADWRGIILSVIDWWVVTHDLLIDVDGMTQGITSAIAADRWKSLKPVTAALHQMMSALGPRSDRQCVLFVGTLLLGDRRDGSPFGVYTHSP
jgi:hypothetical protein